MPEDLYLQELYRRGRQAELSRSQVGIQTAKEAYRRAIARDSTFALAYAGLAGIYGLEATYDYPPMLPAHDSAQMMARRAIALDSMIPDTRAAFAVTLAEAHQFEAAEREFRRAIELGPSNPRAHYWYSMLLVVLGRGDEALREARRTQELDPFAPRAALVMERYATWLVTGDRPHFSTTYTWFNAAIQNDLVGNVLSANTPRNKGTVSLAYADRARLDVAVDARFVAGYHWTTGVWDGDIPASHNVSLSAGYRLNPQVRAFFDATNLLDQPRFEVYGGSVNGRRVLVGMTMMN